jgi:peptidoglycan/LPS O-acetylase OafA/YrhL
MPVDPAVGRDDPAKPPGPGPPPRRLVGIDGLRGVAALSVLAYHVWLYAPGSRPEVLGGVTDAVLPRLALGVTLFFTLSGFLLWRPVAAALTTGAPLPSVRVYMRNRVLRIVPAYWAVLLVTAAAGITVTGWSQHEPTLGVTITDPAFLLRNALLLQSYHPDTLYQGIGPAWSLTVEVVFYVAVPVLGVLAAAAARRTTGPAGRAAAALAPAALLLLVGTAGKVLAAHLSGSHRELLSVSFLGCADLFAFGMVVAVVHGLLVQSGRTLPASWRHRGPAAVVVAVLAAQVVPFTSLFHQTGMAMAFGVLLAAVVLPVAGTGPAPLAHALEQPALAAVGVISFSLYLWHEPLVHLWRASGQAVAGPGGYLINLAVVAATAVALAALTYWAVERTALRRKARA